MRLLYYYLFTIDFKELSKTKKEVFSKLFQYSSIIKLKIIPFAKKKIILTQNHEFHGHRQKGRTMKKPVRYN